jgi:hypothetical protein
MSEAAQKFLTTWFKAIEARDMDIIKPILAEDIVFYSPAFWKPKEGKEVALIILKTVESIFENFTYTKQWVDGNEIILEFSAEVAGKNVKGIDRITLNEQGEAIEFEVMVRPLNGLMLLAQNMGEKLGITAPQ